MKNVSQFLTVCLFIIAIFSCNKSENAAKKLGTKLFSQAAWSSASQEKRAEMVFSFLKQHDLKQLTRDNIISFLGQPTAYYEFDEIPAYFVGPKSVKTEYGEGYIIAFPVNEKGNLRKMIIHQKP